MKFSGLFLFALLASLQAKAETAFKAVFHKNNVSINEPQGSLLSQLESQGVVKRGGSGPVGGGETCDGGCESR